MKRIIYTLFALAAVAVGCTKSNIVDVPEAQKTPITFETYNGKIPVTKASEITQADIAAVQVTGFHVPANGTATYTGKPYMNPIISRTKSGDTWGNWEYAPLSYWPASGSLEFVAYGTNTPRFEAIDQNDEPTPGELVPVDGSYVEFTYTVPTAAADQLDLIAAYVPPTSTPGTVSLNMKHLLSRIGFKLETVGSGTTVTIDDIILHGTFNTTATIDLTETDPIIGRSNTTTSYSLLPGNLQYTTTGASDDSKTATTSGCTYKIYDTATEGLDLNNRYMMIIPETIGEITDGLADENDYDKDGNTTETIIPYIEVIYSLGGVSQEPAKLPLIKDVREQGAEEPVWAIWSFDAGTAYEFLFRVSVSKIEFTGVVEDWDEDINDDGEVDEDDYIS